MPTFVSFRSSMANASSVGAKTVNCPLPESVFTTKGSAASTAAISVSNCPANGPSPLTAIAVSTIVGPGGAATATSVGQTPTTSINMKATRLLLIETHLPSTSRTYLSRNLWSRAIRSL